MERDCQDRDLLTAEPALFAGEDEVAQVLCMSNAAAIAAGKLTAQFNFANAGVRAGMVAAVWQPAALARWCYEIVAVDGQQLSLSIPRAGGTTLVLPPPDGQDLCMTVRTYAAQIAAVRDELLARLRMIREAAAPATIEFADSEQFRQAVAAGALAAVFAARASDASERDANWLKAQTYLGQFQRRQIQLRVAIAPDSSGQPRYTRALGNVQLRRA